MLKIISAQIRSGFLVTESPRTFRKWEYIEAERNIKRDAARIDALNIAEKKNGHQMRPWSIISSSQCNKCGMELFIRNVHSKSNTIIEGRATECKCDNLPDMPSDLPIRTNTYMLE